MCVHVCMLTCVCLCERVGVGVHMCLYVCLDVGVFMCVCAHVCVCGCV